MYIHDQNTLYVITHENKRYYSMNFKRVDWIHGKCYVTFYQEVTGRWFTFEKSSLNFMEQQKENLVS